MRTERVDVTVVGAGPAGAAAALTLARAGVRVLMVERAQNRPIRIGEGLPPGARPTLESLGLWDRLRAAGHLPSHGNRSAWGSDRLVGTDFIFSPYGHGWHLDRQAFDAMVADAAVETGAGCLPALRVEWVSSADGGFLHVQQAGGEIAIRADAAIDCSGRAAVVARSHGAQRLHDDRLVAVATLQHAGAPGDADSTTTVEAVSDGWWYTALLPRGDRIFVFLTDGDLLDRRGTRDPGHWLKLLAQTEHVRELHQRFRYQPATRPTVFPAGTSRLDQAGGLRWLAAGDAALTFDPLSSQGIVTALETGRQAATAVLGALTGHQEAIAAYLSTLDRIRRRYVRSRDEYYAQEQRWPDSPFWQRRLRFSTTPLRPWAPGM